MLNIQEYISCFEDIKQANLYLRSKFSIIAEEQSIISNSDGTQWPAYYYHPGLHSDKNNPIVKESEGLILDEDGDIVAKSFTMAREVESIKDGIPLEFDAGDCHMQEMTDGVRIIIYRHEGEWMIASEASVSGDQTPSQHSDRTYRDIVTTHLNINTGPAQFTWDRPFENVDPRLCFVFDFISRFNLKLAPVYSNSIVLLTIVNTETGKELPQSKADSFSNQWGYDRPKGYHIFNYDIRDFLFQIDVLSKGVMLIDCNGVRVKIINPIYYAIRNAITAEDVISPTHIAKILQSTRDMGDILHIAKTFPQYQHALSYMLQVRDALTEELTILWDAANVYRDDPKEFATMVKEHPLNALMFMMKDRKINSIRDELKNMDAHKLVSNARRKDEKEFDAIKRNIKIGNVLGGAQHGGV